MWCMSRRSRRGNRPLVVSFILISILSAAIYKTLPDRPVGLEGCNPWGDCHDPVKSLVAIYIGSSAIVSSYGAAGALIAFLLWVYYSAQIFLLGAEFTKAYTNAQNPSIEN